ncbi:MAG: DUF488 domain-containing protein [Pseudosphingobacterium sp.]|nr:DUF488 domain-containing protein [Pseudosphingobacterium sp.]
MSDLKTLNKYNIVHIEENSISYISDVDYLKQLKVADQKVIKDIKRIYGKKTNEELMRTTYISHPYYAINSLVAKRLLTEEQYNKVVKSRPTDNTTVLFTIGYEGLSLEEYINKLIKNNIKLLCDVRNNAASMKFGFSKSQLKNGCESVGIEYTHFPEVGIKSEFRQELNSQKDYDELFDEYKKSVIKETLSSQKKIFTLLQKYHRIALTCFEANICQCHRKPLAEAITHLEEWDYELKHI